VKLDWAGILAGSITPDFNVPAVPSGSPVGSADRFPTSTWFTSNPNSWPVIFIHSVGVSPTPSLPAPGHGMIIVDGNFDINGNNMWDGIVLIGGSLTSNGNNTTAGATLSGLNFLIGGTPAGSFDDAVANGTKTYVYNSCNVEKASAGIRVYKPWSNTWMDNVPVW
jgi:hypothetical protein